MNDLEKMQSKLSNSYDDQNALLKIVEDYKFRDSLIVGNKNGLLKLAHILIQTVNEEPGVRNEDFARVERESNENSFKVRGIERDENLRVVTREYDGEQYEVIEHKSTISEYLRNCLVVLTVLFLCSSLVVGIYKIFNWTYGLF